jgi:3-phosphoshikimate 1-carboxyvinyltransferase
MQKFDGHPSNVEGLTCPLHCFTLSPCSRVLGVAAPKHSVVQIILSDKLNRETRVETPPQCVRIYQSGPLSGTILPPSSKYHTLRCILAAVLAEGVSKVYYPADSDDTDVLLRACALLGATMQGEYQPGGRRVLTIWGTGGLIKTSPRAVLDVGNAGAVLRLLLGICALSPEVITFITPYSQSLGRRPNADLLQALAQLGATVESQTAAGLLPITIQRGHLHGGKVQISGSTSSQYISALLFLGPLLEEGLEIEITGGLTSASFIDLTIRILEGAGITVITRQRYQHYVVPGMQRYQPREYTIPGDYPSAAALIAAVAIAGGEVTLHNLLPGEADGENILAVFAKMGVHVTRAGNSITVQRQEALGGINCDGNKSIDSVPVIVAAACFADSPSRIYNVANLRLKESNRIDDLAAELNKAGCNVFPAADAIEIHPVGQPAISGGADLDAHADHRLVEAFAVIGLKSRHPVTISNAYHIAKSYPHFFDDLAKLGAKIERPV